VNTLLSLVDLNVMSFSTRSISIRQLIEQISGLVIFMYANQVELLHAVYLT
jgi:hypothetical protein